MNKKPLIYLLKTKLKNMLKELVRKPSRIIYTLFMLAMLVLVLFTSGMHDDTDVKYRNINEFYAIIFAVYTIVFVFNAQKGFHDGGQLFTMPDVNLIFPAPMRAQRILLYGMTQQLGTSLLIGIFIPFQYGYLSGMYNIPFVAMVYIFLGYTISAFIGQLVAMSMYSFSSGDEKRKKTLQTIFIAILAVLVIYIGISALQSSGDLLTGAVAAINSFPAMLFPFSGWLAMLTKGILIGSLLDIVLGAGLVVLVVFAFIWLIDRSNPDYYEDVLQTAEKSYNAITAKKQGGMQEIVPTDVTVGETGLKNGWGASAFYYKHLIENRRGKKFFFDMTTLIFMAVNIAYAFVMRSVGEDIGIIPIFSFATYMQIFSASLGRFPKELEKPYIYMVPTSSFEKILQSLRESLRPTISEAVITMVVMGLIVGTPTDVIIFATLARISFAFIFVACNIMSMRVFGGNLSKGLIMFFFIVCAMLMAAPGVVLGIFLPLWGITILNAMVTAFICMTLCNVLIGCLAIYLCRNMLQYAEINNA